MHHLSIDLETFSSIPIGEAGAFRYIQSPDFEILLFAYSVDGDPVQLIDLAQGEVVPDWLISALFDASYLKQAYNAAFEYAALSKVYGQMIPSQWRCTMFHGLYCGYTAGLGATGAALGLPEDKQKLSVGKNLIRYFCIPCKPTKSNGMRTRNYPRHDTERWKLFREYNVQDVVTEMEIDRRLSAFPVPDALQKQWETDLLINSRGVRADVDLMRGALKIGDQVRSELVEEAKRISRLDNPNSVSQVLAWINAETDDTIEVTNLQKETVSNLLGKDLQNEDVKRMLEIRQELGKTSTKKYDAIRNCICPDERIRGLLQFYGANRTGRWAGRLVQVQNLPRTYTEPLKLARDLVKSESTDALRLIYGSVPDTLSQLIRTAFIASPGNVLIDADFSAIEARVISWLAGEEWRLNVFKTTGKIYEASAAMIYKVPVETIAKGQPNYHLRQRGKVAELALGYQGGVAAMRRMDTGHALDDLPDEAVQQIVNQWRDANRKIRDLWYSMESAAVTTVQHGTRMNVRGLILNLEYNPAQNTRCLTITLPSQRKLFYINPKLSVNRWGNPSLSYFGVDQNTKKWTEIETYGGKLVENCVQAIARDCLAESIERLEAAGLPVVFHVHDEVVIDAKPFGDEKTMLNTVINLMRQPISWAPGLPLNGDGWVGDFFRKD